MVRAKFGLLFHGSSGDCKKDLFIYTWAPSGSGIIAILYIGQLLFATAAASKLLQVKDSSAIHMYFRVVAGNYFLTLQLYIGIDFLKYKGQVNI